MRRAVGVAGNGAVDLANEPAMARAMLRDPARHFLRVGRIELETDPVVGDERGVDRGAGGRVRFCRRADGRRQSLTAVPLTLTISIEPLLPRTS